MSDCKKCGTQIFGHNGVVHYECAEEYAEILQAKYDALDKAARAVVEQYDHEYEWTDAMDSCVVALTALLEEKDAVQIRETA